MLRLPGDGSGDCSDGGGSGDTGEKGLGSGGGLDLSAL